MKYWIIFFFTTSLFAQISPVSQGDIISAQKFNQIITEKQDVSNKNKYQVFKLASNINSDQTWLTIGNLEIGKYYRITGKLSMVVNSGAFYVNIIHNGNNLGRFACDASGGSAKRETPTPSFIFKASVSTIEFDAVGLGTGEYLEGNNTRRDTYIQIEELNGGEPLEVNDFTSI